MGGGSPTVMGNAGGIILSAKGGSRVLAVAAVGRSKGRAEGSRGHRPVRRPLSPEWRVERRSRWERGRLGAVKRDGGVRLDGMVWLRMRRWALRCAAEGGRRAHDALQACAMAAVLSGALAFVPLRAEALQLPSLPRLWVEQLPGGDGGRAVKGGAKRDGGLEAKKRAGASLRAGHAREVTDSDIVREAWRVIDEHYLDVRGAGGRWEPGKWARERDEALRPFVGNGRGTVPSGTAASRGAAYAAVRKMLGSLNDPFTRFLTPGQFAELQKYDMTGIGINIAEEGSGVAREANDRTGRPGKLRVVGILLGSPSQMAGIRQGDELLAVDGVSVSGVGAFDAAAMIQNGTRPRAVVEPVDTQAQTADSQTAHSLSLPESGSGIPVGSDLNPSGEKTDPLAADVNTVTVTLRHLPGRGPEEGSAVSSMAGKIDSDAFASTDGGEIYSVTLRRADRVRNPVMARLERQGGENVGFVKLREFNAVAKREVQASVSQLESMGATAYVLDLQDNPGGLLQAGIEIAKLFLGDGEVVVNTVGRDGDLVPVVARGEPLTTAPLILLVNERTASASEIVSAALHDNCRASLVGRRTYGKGLIQSVFELSDGSGVVVTVSKYVTPALKDIDKNGLQPDFFLRPSVHAAREQQAQCARERKEKRQDFNSGGGLDPVVDLATARSR